MRPLRQISFLMLLPVTFLAAGCSSKSTTTKPAEIAPQPAVSYFKVDPATAGSITGKISYTGKRPAPKAIDMSEDPACVAAHHGKAFDETLVVGKGVANVFIYIKSGLDGKKFAPPSDAVVIDQAGCQFHPHVAGIQVDQPLRIINSDPVTHNIHPMAEINHEWNHSQGPGDPAMNRKFTKPEIMIPVKCNIHGWMHAYIGVVDNPYFAVTKDDGSFEIKNLPPGTYTLAIWQEKLGTQEQQITITPGSNSTADFTYKGK